MKIAYLLLIAALCGMGLGACSTAGYVAGRTMEKTGHVVSHAGDEVEEHSR